VHFDNLLFILLLAMAALLRLLASKAGESKKKSQEPGQTSTSAPPPLPRAPAESDEERIRKFLEALGQPTTSKPPPPATPRTHIPPRPIKPVQPPAEMRPFAAPPWPSVEKPLPTRKIPSAKPVPTAMTQPAAPQPTTVIIESPRSFPVHEVKVLPLPLAPAAEVPTALPPLTSYEAQSFAPILDRSLSALLASPEGLRRAIMLREIFGPPRSLQPLDERRHL
jgi:hypothetical protein